MITTAEPAHAVPKKRLRSRYAPALSAREADERWGLGNVGRAQRGEIDAYTALHFAEDEAAGIIVVPVARACPQHRPDRACKPRDVPAYYRTAWLRRTTVRARRPQTIAVPASSLHIEQLSASGSRSGTCEGGPPLREIGRGRIAEPSPVVPVALGPAERPQRRTQRMPVICYDCATWLDWRARRDFADEVGDDVARFDRPRLADAGATLKQLYEQAHDAYRELMPITGAVALSLREPTDWPKVIALAAAVSDLIAREGSTADLTDLVSRFCG